MLSDATPTAHAVRRRAEPETPFENFCQMNADVAAREQQFLAYVRGCGGGEHTDCLTLAYLYDIWTKLGLADSTSVDEDDDESRALHTVSRMWGGRVVAGLVKLGHAHARSMLNCKPREVQQP